MFDLLDDSSESDDNDTTASVEYQTVRNTKEDAAGAHPTTLRALSDSTAVTVEKQQSTTTTFKPVQTERTTEKPTTQPKKPHNLPSSTPSTLKYPTECDNPATCSGFSRVIADSYVMATLLILSIFIKGF